MRLIARVMWNVAAGVAALTMAGNAHATGAMTYSSRCSMCHQPSGAGLAGQFPRLGGRVDRIAASPAGRVYLAKVLLFGMYGTVTVDGQPINGLMPTMGSLSDQDVADVLNQVVSLNKRAKHVAPFTAAEIAGVRASGPLTSAAVAKERAGLVAKGLIP